MRLSELFENMGALDSPSANLGDPKDDLISAVSDVITMAMADDVTKVPTRMVQDMLRRSGYNVSMDELIMALDQSGFTSSQDKTMITTKDEIPPEISQNNYDARSSDTDNDTGVDVEKIAGDQAMKDIKK